MSDMSQVEKMCPVCRGTSVNAPVKGFFGEYKQAEEQRQFKEVVARHLKEAEVLANVAGGPAWVALDVDMEYRCALLISRSILTQRPYNTTGESTNWDSCSLREWLNGPFLSSLPAHMSSQVVEVTNQNPGCGIPTRDKVFLLSINEAHKYFQSDFDRIAKSSSSAGWWWLRSPGYYKNFAALVRNHGHVDDLGDVVSNDSGGVRPALILSLDPSESSSPRRQAE